MKEQINEKEVTLNYEDLVELAEHVNKKNPNNDIGPAFLEYCLFDGIRKFKNVDFFKEEEKRIGGE